MGLPVNAVVEATIRGAIHGQTTLSVYHYYVAVASTIPVVLDEMEQFLTTWSDLGVGTFLDTYRVCMPDNWSLVEIVAQPIYPLRYRRSVLAIGSDGARAASNVSNLQASLTFQTDFSGRSHIGGKRMPMSDIDSVNGLVAPTLKIALQNHAVQVLTPVVPGVGGALYQPCIYHRSPNANPRFNLITACFPQDQTRVIRRRTVGLGI